jgi:catechol 2,3-dioxygenase-like lactoylglutathione lyase family enzyme
VKADFTDTRMKAELWANTDPAANANYNPMDITSATQRLNLANQECHMNDESLTRGVDHVGLSVLDLKVTLDFFVDCLGWKQVGGKPDYPAAFVTDGHALLTLWQVQDPGDAIAFDRKRNVGLHHLALRAASEEAFAEIFARVSAWPGVRVEFSPELLGNGPKRHSMVYEPGGVRLEFDLNPQADA